MNKSESKYFNTAKKMDIAFLELLEEKDFEYITVKEICKKAGVNRSTFYLHYETISDLLSESAEYINRHFIEYMKINLVDFMSKLNDCPIEELNLIIPEYLIPYLSYIKEHKSIFKTSVKNASVLNLDKSYSLMFEHIFNPIMNRFKIPLERRNYIMSFYISELMAIISEWLKSDCKESVENLIAIIEDCVLPDNKENRRSQ
jgi:AcrR family transcriptional regulator